MAKMAKILPKQPPAYERRLILFIDFLGFKEVVARTAKDQAELGALIDALEEIKPPRVCGRPQLLRGRGHDEQDDEQVLT